MTLGNSIVKALLRSPVHGLLSGSTDLVRYSGRRSGRTIITPTQYATRGDEVVILVGNPHAKRWWRNFAEERDLEVLLRGSWRPMVGLAVVGADDPETMGPLLTTYLERFPRAARALEGATAAERTERAVVVWCRPRPAP